MIDEKKSEPARNQESCATGEKKPIHNNCERA